MDFRGWLIAGLVILYAILFLVIGCGSDEKTDTLKLKVTTPPFALAVVPDAQSMTCCAPSKFVNQMRWTRDNAGMLNIVFVSQVGDITYNNTSAEWSAARTALYQLDGVVPYGLAPGNHDSPGDYANFNNSFPYSKYAGETWYGGGYQGKNTNSYQLFSASGLDFVITHLAHAPDAKERAWAEDILHANMNRRAIIATHSYLNTDGSLTAEGSAIWSMIKSHDNVIMVVCGHMHGQKYITQKNDFGHTVHILLTDYQSETQVGKFRYYQFRPDENKVYAYTYGVETARFYTDSASQFSFNLTMGPPPPPPPPDELNTLVVDQILLPGKYLESSNAEWRLYFQDSDGNLVLRNFPSMTVRWASGTNGKGGARLLVQQDGNLVMYRSDNKPVWASNTVGSGAARLTLSNDGVLGLYNSVGALLWSKP